MKALFFCFAFLIALGVIGVAGFLIGYQQFENSLLASPRSPMKLQMSIATLEQEKITLQGQVSDLQKQVEDGVAAQAAASKSVADLEKSLAEQKQELESARAALVKSKGTSAQ